MYVKIRKRRIYFDKKKGNSMRPPGEIFAKLIFHQAEQVPFRDSSFIHEHLKEFSVSPIIGHISVDTMHLKLRCLSHCFKQCKTRKFGVAAKNAILQRRRNHNIHIARHCPAKANVRMRNRALDEGRTTQKGFALRSF